MVLPALSDCAAAIDRVAPVLIDAAPRSVLVLGIAAVIAVAMRRASAAARHWVWLMGFAGLLALPALLAVVPGWRVLPRIDREPAPAQFTIVPPAQPAAVESPSQGPDAGHFQQRTPGAQIETKTVTQPAPAPTQTNAPLPVPAPTQLAHAAQPAIVLSWASWLALTWLTGALLVLVHLLMGYVSLWLLQRRCSPVTDADWSDLLSELRRELGVQRDVRLLSSPQRTMPMTWGLWRTRLLLPEQAMSWPREQRQSVLLHELGHVKRCDCLAQLLTQIACALYWFNPLVWFGWHRMQVERERACDDLVLNTGAKASSYARHLLDSASSILSPRLVTAAVAIARPSTLEERLRAILDTGRNRDGLRIRTVLAMTLLLAAALVPVAALRAQQRPMTAAELAEAEAQEIAQAAGATPATRPAAGNPRFRRVDGTGSGFSGGEAPVRVGGRGGARGMGGQPVLGEGPTCALDATIYRVHLPADQIGRLDLGALNNASDTAEQFEKALTALGPITPLYRAGQSVRLAGDSIQIGTETPYVTASRTDNSGRVVNTIQYTNTGAIFSIAGRAGGGPRVELDLTVEVSSMTESGTEIGPGVKAPLHRVAKMSHKGMVDADKPFVVVSVDAASPDAAGKAVAYIARVTLGPPEGGAGVGQ